MPVRSTPVSRRHVLGLGLAGLGALALAGCTTGGGGLAPGLTARMDNAGARLDRAEALRLINAYRTAQGAAPLMADPALDAKADELARQYAASGSAPKKPAEAQQIRVSAGYANFAETFSGWRNSGADAQVLAAPDMGRAGIGVAYQGNSAYGVHWVLLLAHPG